MSDDATTRQSRPNWALIFGLLVGVVAALALFIPAIMTRPSPKPVSTPVSTTAAVGLSGPIGLPAPIGGSSVSLDVNTLVGKPAPAFTLSDSEERTFPVSPGGGTRTVLIFNMGVT